ncbi:tyrosine-protein phosphatase [Gordonia sp. CPCC 205515]|uniref:tyrosine-protein phosphatase n=1 Tax=Gordonia sp. CPCC 205515 TaxID=3140791 RepID=UPI003AF3C067
MTEQLDTPGLTSVANFRDVGGWPTTDGRTVVTGRVFRSAALAKASEADRRFLADLGLRTVADLRSVAEADAAPDPEIGDARGVLLDVLADAARISAPANLDTLIADPEAVAEANDRLATGSGVEHMIGAYRGLVNLPSAKRAYRELFTGLLDGTPTLFHCTAGKDRTGWAAAVFLSLMGVDRDDVFTDYLRTNEQFLPAMAHVFEGFEAAGGDPDLLRPLLGVQSSYLAIALEEVTIQYGTIEHYFAEALGIDAAAQDRLRELYLT